MSSELLEIPIIDKISIIFKTSLGGGLIKQSRAEFNLFIRDILDYLKEEKLIIDDFKRSKLYQFHFKLVGDVDFQFVPFYPSKKVLQSSNLDTGEITRLIMYFDNNNYFRFEFNPQKSDILKIQKFLLFLKELFSLNSKKMYVSRIDTAIDYAKYFNLMHIDSKTSKSFAYVGNRGDGILTNYQGSRNSSIMFRIYDKKAEIESRNGVCEYEKLTRFELVNSEGFFMNDFDFKNYFEKISFAYYPVRIDDDPILNLIIRLIHHESELVVLSEFNKVQRCRYRNRLEKYRNNLDFIHPSVIYERDFKNVYNEFKNNFYKCMEF